jgi:UDP-N-acetylglucosamine acyltransferase
MATVHQTSILSGDVQLADDVSIGPYCVLDGTSASITIGSGSRLLGHSWLHGPLTVGANNTIYPFACLGFSPQDLKWDPLRPGAGVVIGEGNTFREHVTIHRATSDDQPTTIGNNNYFMASSHAGHDCTIGNHCIFANGTLFGGFVRVDDRVITGGTAAVHQFCRIGRGAMLSGTAGMTQDLPPFFMLTATNVAGSINLIGLRRSNTPADVIEDVRWVYKTLYRRGLSTTTAVEQLRARGDRPMVREYIEFITSGKRGICRGIGKSARSSVGSIQSGEASS